MEIRKLQLPKDIDPLVEVSLASFQYPDNPEWSVDPGEAEELRDQVKAIKRYWPLLRVGMLFSSTLRHLFQGFVCEENGRMVGTVMYQQRGGKTPVYYINDVAVHPDSRRKGIARKLVEATLAEMRSQGSCVILLDVIDGNIPAYRLYESLGWEHFAGSVHLLLGADQTVSPAEKDAAYELKDLPGSDWETHYRFVDSITPEAVRKYNPVNPDDFKGNRLMNLLETLMGLKTQKTALIHKETGKVVGFITYQYRTRTGGTQYARVMVDPAHSPVAAYLIESVAARTKSLAPGRRLEMVTDAWQPDVIHCALEKGFTKRYEYHSMGMIHQA